MRHLSIHRSNRAPVLRVVALALSCAAGLIVVLPAAAEETGKTGLTLGQPSSALRLHRHAELGFSFRYPGVWREQRPGGRRGLVKVGAADGASCTVSVKRQEVAADPSGRPHDLDVYLGRLERGKFTFPAQFKARIVEFGSSTLGSQPAKRMVINLGINKTTLVQYLTFRNYGVIVLTCSARNAKFNTPEMQRHIKTVKQSFKF